MIGTGLNTNQHMHLSHVITSHPILTGSYTQPVTQITHPSVNQPNAQPMIPQPDMSHYVTQTTNLYPNFYVPATGTTQQATFTPTNGPTIPSTSNYQVQLCELFTKMMAR